MNKTGVPVGKAGNTSKVPRCRMGRTAARWQKDVRVFPARRGGGGGGREHKQGLSWAAILYRRPAYRKAFERFSPDKISRYTKNDVDSILKNPDIIRNRKKAESFVNNAKKFLEIKDEFGTFDEYIRDSLSVVNWCKSPISQLEEYFSQHKQDITSIFHPV